MYRPRCFRNERMSFQRLVDSVISIARFSKRKENLAHGVINNISKWKSRFTGKKITQQQNKSRFPYRINTVNCSFTCQVKLWIENRFFMKCFSALVSLYRNNFRFKKRYDDLWELWQTQYFFSNSLSRYFSILQNITSNSIKEIPLHGARSLFLLKKEKWFIKEIRKTILENSSFSNFLPIHIWELFWLLLCISFNSKKIYVLCLIMPRGMGGHSAPPV